MTQSPPSQRARDPRTHTHISTRSHVPTRGPQRALFPTSCPAWPEGPSVFQGGAGVSWGHRCRQPLGKLLIHEGPPHPLLPGGSSEPRTVGHHSARLKFLLHASPPGTRGVWGLLTDPPGLPQATRPHRPHCPPCETSNSAQAHEVVQILFGAAPERGRGRGSL